MKTTCTYLNTSNKASRDKECSVLQGLPGWERRLVSYYSHLVVMLVVVMMVMMVMMMVRVMMMVMVVMMVRVVMMVTGVIIVNVVTLRRKINVIG